MTPEEKADLLHDCDLLAPAGDATTTRLNGASIRRVVKAARAYAEISAASPALPEGDAMTNDEKRAVMREEPISEDESPDRSESKPPSEDEKRMWDAVRSVS